MISMENLEKLLHFGLSRVEASVYLCLHQRGALTGYEASKLTGISRSNIYGALNGLVEKGAAWLEEGASTRYIAVPIQEFLDNRMASLEKYRSFLIENIPKQEKSQDGYISIQGAENIRDKFRQMVRDSALRLYLSAPADIVDSFQPELKAASERGVKIILISDLAECDFVDKLLQDEIEPGQIRLITDSSSVLTGDLYGNASDTCLFSGKENLVRIMKEALRNKIILLEMRINK